MVEDGNSGVSRILLGGAKGPIEYRRKCSAGAHLPLRPQPSNLYAAFKDTNTTPLLDHNARFCYGDLGFKLYRDIQPGSKAGRA